MNVMRMPQPANGLINCKRPRGVIRTGDMPMAGLRYTTARFEVTGATGRRRPYVCLNVKCLCRKYAAKTGLSTPIVCDTRSGYQTMTIAGKTNR